MNANDVAARWHLPVEFVHPRGIVLRRRIIGGAWLPPEGQIMEDGPLDLVVVALEAGDARALERDVFDALSRLDADGIAYVLGSRAARAASRRPLEAAGLVSRCSLAHAPDFSRSTFVFPLGGRAARHVLEELSLLSRPRVFLARTIMRRPVLLRAAVRAIGTVYTHPGAPRPFAWLEELTGGITADVAITRTHGGRGEAFVLLPFRPNATAPILVVKIAPKATLDLEAAMLATAGSSARSAGAAVPRILAERDLGQWQMLVQEGLGGHVAATHLRRRPRDLERVVRLIGDWLVRWNQGTVSLHRLSAERLEAEVLRPAKHLAPNISAGSRYVADLEALCSDLVGAEVPLVAGHGDLTMWNVLVCDRSIGVVDWEASRIDALPLLDLYYAVVDAVAATYGYRSRARAAYESFSRYGERRKLASDLERRVAEAVGAQRELMNLSFHGCWLHHAANEARLARTTRPFLEVLDAIASREMYSR